MEPYVENALGFVESEEMRNYFRTVLIAENERVQLSYCIDFIVRAFTSIEQKLSALKKLPSNKKTDILIKIGEYAISETSSVPSNVYLVTQYIATDIFEDDDHALWEERAPCLSFESVRNYIEKRSQYASNLGEIDPLRKLDHIWFRVEKFIPNETSELTRIITWILDANGEIIYFEPGDEQKDELLHLEDSTEWNAWSDWSCDGHWEYPPVPFDFGDIITIDMSPFHTSIHGVVVRLCDNRFCCAVACIYCDDEGNLYCGTLKHNLTKIMCKKSPLFRATTSSGELPEHEQILGIISNAIKQMPSEQKMTEIGSIWRTHPLAKQYDDFLYSGDYEKADGYSGCSIEMFRKKFGL